MRHMSVSGEPVVACVPLMIGVGVCSGGTLYQVSTDKQSVTVSYIGCMRVETV